MSRKPCQECPYSRAVEPGGTGGSCPTIYVGQAYGPFLLPCHMAPGYEDDRRNPGNLQCAGAAIFRKNIGVDVLMPKEMLSLEADTTLVFTDPAELISHHMQIPLWQAAMVLYVTPPQVLLKRELEKTSIQYLDRTKVRKD